MHSKLLDKYSKVEEMKNKFRQCATMVQNKYDALEKNNESLKKGKNAGLLLYLCYYYYSYYVDLYYSFMTMFTFSFIQHWKNSKGGLMFGKMRTLKKMVGGLILRMRCQLYKMRFDC